MKRSKTVKMFLLSTVMATALTGCFDDEEKSSTEGYYFKDEKECYKTFDNDTCSEISKQAQETHEKSAPKFSEKEHCESSYGENNCTKRVSMFGNDYFVPLMTGFMVSKMLNNNSCNNNDKNCNNYVHGGSAYVHPYYYGYGGTTYGPASSIVTRTMPPTNSTILSSPPAHSSVATPSVSRGGFGSSAHASGVAS